MKMGINRGKMMTLPLNISCYLTLKEKRIQIRIRLKIHAALSWPEDHPARNFFAEFTSKFHGGLFLIQPKMLTSAKSEVVCPAGKNRWKNTYLYFQGIKQRSKVI